MFGPPYFLRFKRIYAPDIPNAAAVTSTPQGVKVGIGRGPFLVPAIAMPDNKRTTTIGHKLCIVFILALLNLSDLFTTMI